jgi:peptidoglycan-associated lipoprotein
MKISKQILLIASILFIILASGCSKSLLHLDMDGSLEYVEEDLGEEDGFSGLYEKPGPPRDFGVAEKGMPGNGSTGSFIAEPFHAEPSQPENGGDRVSSLPPEYEKPGPPRDFGSAEQGMPGNGSTGSFVAEPFHAEPSQPENGGDRVSSLPPEFEKPGPPRDFGSAEEGMPGNGSTGSFVAEPFQAEPFLPENGGDKVASLPLKEEVQARLLPYRSTHLLDDINFAFDRYDLDESSKAILENNMVYLMSYPNIKIEIQGHCDERGTNRYNISLGQRRAQSTKSYLIFLGVDERRIRTISYGEEKPFCFESNEICWYKNRRAHFLATVPSLDQRS